MRRFLGHQRLLAWLRAAARTRLALVAALCIACTSAQAFERLRALRIGMPEASARHVLGPSLPTGNEAAALVVTRLGEHRVPVLVVFGAGQLVSITATLWGEAALAQRPFDAALSQLRRLAPATPETRVLRGCAQTEQPQPLVLTSRRTQTGPQAAVVQVDWVGGPELSLHAGYDIDGYADAMAQALLRLTREALQAGLVPQQDAAALLAQWAQAARLGAERSTVCPHSRSFAGSIARVRLGQRAPDGERTHGHVVLEGTAVRVSTLAADGRIVRIRLDKPDASFTDFLRLRQWALDRLGTPTTMRMTDAGGAGPKHLLTWADARGRTHAVAVWGPKQGQTVASMRLQLNEVPAPLY